MPQLKVVKGTAANTTPDLARKSDLEILVFFGSGKASVTAGVAGKTFRFNQIPPLRMSSITKSSAKTNLVAKVMKNATNTMERMVRRRSRKAVAIIPSNKSAEYVHHKIVNVLVFAHFILVVLSAL